MKMLPELKSGSDDKKNKDKGKVFQPHDRSASENGKVQK